MKPEEIRDEKSLIVHSVMELLMSHGFTLEYVVRKKPKGIKVIYEVTQEQMDALIENDKKENNHGKEEEVSGDDSHREDE